MYFVTILMFNWNQQVIDVQPHFEVILHSINYQLRHKQFS